MRAHFRIPRASVIIMPGWKVKHILHNIMQPIKLGKANQACRWSWALPRVDCNMYEALKTPCQAGFLQTHYLEKLLQSYFAASPTACEFSLLRISAGVITHHPALPSFPRRHVWFVKANINLPSCLLWCCFNIFLGGLASILNFSALQEHVVFSSGRPPNQHAKLYTPSQCELRLLGFYSGVRRHSTRANFRRQQVSGAALKDKCRRTSFFGEAYVLCCRSQSCFLCWCGLVRWPDLSTTEDFIFAKNISSSGERCLSGNCDLFTLADKAFKSEARSLFGSDPLSKIWSNVILLPRK